MKKVCTMLPFLGLVFLLGCGTKSVAPVAQTTTTTPTVVDCKSDMNCLQKNFIACTPVTFTFPLTADSNLNFDVIGETDKICDYKVTIVNTKQGSSAGTECKLPMALMNADRAGHLFWVEKAPGKEALAQTQQELDTQYCTTF